MAAPAGHFRTHWKKYAFGTVAYTLAVRYFTKKHREKNVIREYCNQAKKFGDQKISGVLEKPRKIFVFLNPRANKIEAKSQFMKYAAPLFNLSGADVTIVESEYEGQIRTLLAYIDPKTDAIVVAGGDGTLLEVVNGLLRRYDVDKTQSIPIGVIPLGRENRFYHSRLLAASHSSPARRISEATMSIIRDSTEPVHMVEIKPENGRTVYAMSSIEWGSFKEAYENRDNFRLFGKLRLFLSYLSTAVRKWPTDNLLHVWLPPAKAHASLASVQPLSAHCASVTSSSQLNRTGSNGNATTSLAVRVPACTHEVSPLIGFKMVLQRAHTGTLQLTVWPSDISKTAFIKHGWSETAKQPSSLPFQSRQGSEFILQPVGEEEEEGGGRWVSVDGEPYEAVPMVIKVRPSALNVFSSKQC